MVKSKDYLKREGINLNMEAEVTAKVYRMRELHEEFSKGNYEEMNDNYSDDFQGWLYMPWNEEVEFFNAEEIKQGNQEAAAYYKGKKLKFGYSSLKVIPQSNDQAAVSYEIKHQQDEEEIVRAISLEAWRKDLEGKWRMVRWYEEKGQG